MFCRYFIFFAYMKIICQTLSKNSDCKIQITVKKTPISERFFNQTLSPVQITKFFGNLSKVVEATLAPPIPLSYLRGWNGNFECLFYKNMKDAFSEGLTYITYFVVLDPFLRRPQILLTFISHLTLIKSNLIK